MEKTKVLSIPFFKEDRGFEGAAVAEISEYNWGGNYQPSARARVFYTMEALHLHLEAEEQADHLRIVEGGLTGSACCDSCMEFFLMPCPDKDSRYFNFELTAGGAIFLGLGHDRYDNQLLKGTDLAQFDIQTVVRTGGGKAFWQVEAKIPFSFIKETMGIEAEFGSGTKMRGNFYKCADDCRERHYGTWNQVGTEKPDYHRPEYFGELILQ